MSTSAGLRDVARELQQLKEVAMNMQGVKEAIIASGENIINTINANSAVQTLNDMSSLSVLKSISDISAKTFKSLSFLTNVNTSMQELSSNMKEVLNSNNTSNKQLSEQTSIQAQQLEISKEESEASQWEKEKVDGNVQTQNDGKQKTKVNKEKTEEKTDFFKNIFKKIGTTLGSVFDGFELFGLILFPFLKVFSDIFNMITPLFVGGIKAVLKRLFVGLMALDFIGAIFDEEKMKSVTGKENNSLMDKIIAAFSSVVSDFTFGLLGTPKEIYKTITSSLNAVLDLIRGGTAGFLGKLGPSVGNLLVKIYNGVLNAFTQIYPAVINTLANVLGLDYSFVKKVIEEVGSSVLNVFSSVKNLFSDIVNLFSSGGEAWSIGATIKKFIFAILNSFQTIVNNILDVISQYLGKDNLLIKIVRTIFNVLIEGVKFFVDAISSMFDGILDFLGIKTKKQQNLDNFKKDTSSEERKANSDIVENMKNNPNGKVNVVDKDYEGMGVTIKAIELKDDISNISKEEAKALIKSGQLDKKDEQRLFQEYFSKDYIIKDELAQKELERINLEKAEADKSSLQQKTNELLIQESKTNAEKTKALEEATSKNNQSTNTTVNNTTVNQIVNKTEEQWNVVASQLKNLRF